MTARGLLGCILGQALSTARTAPQTVVNRDDVAPGRTWSQQSRCRQRTGRCLSDSAHMVRGTDQAESGRGKGRGEKDRDGPLRTPHERGHKSGTRGSNRHSWAPKAAGHDKTTPPESKQTNTQIRHEFDRDLRSRHGVANSVAQRRTKFNERN